MNPSSRLSPDGFARAAKFLQQSRPLDRALFEFHFHAGSAAAVRRELQAFQNADGGFHGQEADIGFAQSTVLSTCHALHLQAEVGTFTDNPTVLRALDYLLGTFDEGLQAWPIIPPHDNSAPHAPWWNYSENFAANFGMYLDNPRPDVLACLHAFRCTKTDGLRQQADRVVAARAKATAKMDMQGVICYARLYQAPGLPVELKQALDRHLPSWIDQAVERDSAKWTGYLLRPLDVAPLADSPWRARLAPSIEANLDFLIRSQAEDGSWSPHWNWGDAFPEAWPAAKRKWQAVLTLRALLSLRSYGRTTP